MKKRNIFLFLTILLILVVFINAKCTTSSSAEGKQTEETNKILTEINNQIGMPNIVNFQEKKLAKMIFELRDKEDLICYAYLISEYNGQLVFIGKCLGFGLPYSVQYTNPEKLVDRYGRSIGNNTYEPHSLPQADPNGLYMPDGLSATWLMMLDSEGEARPVYVEPQIIVSPFILH